jgi:hypothetical protein
VKLVDQLLLLPGEPHPGARLATTPPLAPGLRLGDPCGPPSRRRRRSQHSRHEPPGGGTQVEATSSACSSPSSVRRPLVVLPSRSSRQTTTLVVLPLRVGQQPLQAGPLQGGRARYRLHQVDGPDQGSRRRRAARNVSDGDGASRRGDTPSAGLRAFAGRGRPTDWGVAVGGSAGAATTGVVASTPPVAGRQSRGSVGVILSRCCY